MQAVFSFCQNVLRLCAVRSRNRARRRLWPRRVSLTRVYLSTAPFSSKMHIFLAVIASTRALSPQRTRLPLVRSVRETVRPAGQTVAAPTDAGYDLVVVGETPRGKDVWTPGRFKRCGRRLWQRRLRSPEPMAGDSAGGRAGTRARGRPQLLLYVRCDDPRQRAARVVAEQDLPAARREDAEAPPHHFGPRENSRGRRKHQLHDGA